MRISLEPEDTQMNNAEIAKRLDGMECGGVTLLDHSTAGDPCLTIGRICKGMPLAAMAFIPTDLLALCRAVVDKVDGPAKPINIERIIYALQLWMKRIVMGIPVHSQEGWEVRWERLEKVIEDWKTKGEMPK